ncbi:MAG: efflux RND transporter periplasmic adaptor subunit [Bacteroidales bacterium]|nr:efflux RND transporter periplasmic adaptor subunit [Bacteroidales bacterium]
MKTDKLILTGVAVILTLGSCSRDSRSELSKLKKQQALIEQKIKILEQSNYTPAENTPDPVKFRFVGVKDIRPEVFDHYIRIQGKLDADQNVGVYAEVPGTIVARYADVGHSVKKGAVLAQIDDQQLRKQLESLLTQFKFAAEMFEKQERLWEQKIGSEVQYLQSKTAKVSLEQQISAMNEQIEKYRIKSPVSGTVEECNIRVGSVVSPDPHSAAFRVVAFRNLKVSGEVSEAYASRVQPGDKAIILFPDINTRIEARVDFVSRYIDPVNRTFLIESSIPQSFPGMKANMIAVIQINDYHSDKSILIPMNVILNDRQGSYVYVVRKKDVYDGAFKQPVVIGNTYNGVAEILNGLTANDKVVTAGFHELIDGEYVRFDKQAEAHFGGSSN